MLDQLVKYSAVILSVAANQAYGATNQERHNDNALKVKKLDSGSVAKLKREFRLFAPTSQAFTKFAEEEFDRRGDSFDESFNFELQMQHRNDDGDWVAESPLEQINAGYSALTDLNGQPQGLLLKRNEELVFIDAFLNTESIVLFINEEKYQQYTSSVDQRLEVSFRYDDKGVVIEKKNGQWRAVINPLPDQLKRCKQNFGFNPRNQPSVVPIHPEISPMSKKQVREYQKEYQKYLAKPNGLQKFMEDEGEKQDAVNARWGLSLVRAEFEMQRQRKTPDQGWIAESAKERVNLEPRMLISDSGYVHGLLLPLEEQVLFVDSFLKEGKSMVFTHFKPDGILESTPKKRMNLSFEYNEPGVIIQRDENWRAVFNPVSDQEKPFLNDDSGESTEIDDDDEPNPSLSSESPQYTDGGVLAQFADVIATQPATQSNRKRGGSVKKAESPRKKRPDGIVEINLINDDEDDIEDEKSGDDFDPQSDPAGSNDDDDVIEVKLNPPSPTIVTLGFGNRPYL